ncbi:class I SAM-dependent methyltransferase, partial [Candidatus Dependentiae bacterium HGW-Dependentiae-1]
MFERSFERLRVHYELEKKLATRLKEAPAQERPTLYTQVYDE